MAHIETYRTVAVMYFVAASILSFAATYTWLTWRLVKGVRGISIAILCLSLAVITSTLGLLHSNVSPNNVYLAVQRTMWVPVVVFSFALADLYAADYSMKRSVVARVYKVYLRFVCKYFPRRLQDETRAGNDSANNHCFD